MSVKVEVNENIILQNYMLERLLERISVSKYKYKLYLPTEEEFKKELNLENYVKKDIEEDEI